MIPGVVTVNAGVSAVSPEEDHPLRIVPGPTWFQPVEGSGCAVFGDLSRQQTQAIVTQLTTSLDPGESASRLPWAVVTPRPDGSIIASASPTLLSGLFYAHSPGPSPRLTVGLDPRSVFEAAGVTGDLEKRFFAGFLFDYLDPALTPIAGINRLTPGTSVVWHPGQPPEVSRWWFPTEGSPPLRGKAAVRSFLTAFDTSIAELVEPAGALSAELSGGLDSTFVVAALARTDPGRGPVQAYTHAPAHGATTNPRQRFEPDDSAYALTMAAAYPERLDVRIVRNDQGRLALDAARDAAQRSWWPSYNPANQVWLDQIRGLALARGSRMLFTGSKGNFAFSNEHSYALARSLHRGDLFGATRATRHLRHGGASWETVAHLAKARPVARGHSPARPRRDFLRTDRIPPGLPESRAPAEARTQFLRALYGINRPFTGALNPRATNGLIIADPFATRVVVETAAAISPVEWLNGPWPRGLARTLGVGRVPDSIRLRKTRGSQSADAWWHLRGSRTRYLDEALQLRETPLIQDWIDDQAVAATLQAWPWGDSGAGPAKTEINRVDRLLSLAAFARYLSAEFKASITHP